MSCLLYLELMVSVNGLVPKIYSRHLCVFSIEM
jgi:hypothetical protein